MANISIHTDVDINFHHRTLSALPHDCLPTLEPCTKSRISARFMARGDETPRAHQGGAPRAGDRSPRPSRDVCAELLRLDVLWKPKAFPLGGLSPPRTERAWGVASAARSGPAELLLAAILFDSAGPEHAPASQCIATPQLV